MKIPTKTIEIPDWDSLYELIKNGSVVFIDGMALSDIGAFKMHLRKFYKVGLKGKTRLDGSGVDVMLGKPVKDPKAPKRVYKKKALT